MTISFSGLASGLDTSAWVNSLVALKRAKITTLETKKENVQLSQTTLSTIKSIFSQFRTTVERVTDSRFGISTMDAFTQNIATSSNTNKLTASATSDAEARSYNIKVNQLAKHYSGATAYWDNYEGNLVIKNSIA